MGGFCRITWNFSLGIIRGVSGVDLQWIFQDRFNALASGFANSSPADVLTQSKDPSGFLAIFHSRLPLKFPMILQDFRLGFPAIHFRIILECVCFRTFFFILSFYFEDPVTGFLFGLSGFNFFSAQDRLRF